MLIPAVENIKIELGKMLNELFRASGKINEMATISPRDIFIYTHIKEKGKFSRIYEKK